MYKHSFKPTFPLILSAMTLPISGIGYAEPQTVIGLIETQLQKTINMQKELTRQLDESRTKQIEAEQKLNEIDQQRVQEVTQLKQQITTLEERLAKQEQTSTALTTWKDNLTPEQLHAEARYTQTITIGGSKDMLYPVWWGFLWNDFGVGRITFHRSYHEKFDTGEPATGLLLEIEGTAHSWVPDANFVEIKRFSPPKNGFVSHVQAMMFAHLESNDGVNPPTNGAEGLCPGIAGLYLRGGGITYHITKNWPGDVGYLDGSDPHQQAVINVINNSRWVVKPIPWAQHQEPKENVNAFVDPPTP